MRWEEVKKLYPNQFVKIEILTSHLEGEKEIVDNMALIEPIEDERATSELLNSKDNILIFHTSKDELSTTIRKRVGLRRIIQ